MHQKSIILKVLITGSAGFIGFHLAKKLLEDNHHVVGIDNLNSYYDISLKKGRLELLKPYANFQFFKVDLTDLTALKQLFTKENFEVVINLAAQPGVRYSLENPNAYIQSNIVGFTNLLECCRYHHIQHLVFASSSSVYGMNSSIPFNTGQNVDHPISLYAATKKSNELLAHTYSHLFNLPTTGLRFFTVYGPWGRPDMAYMLFANAIYENRPIQIFNHGKMKRDFTYVGDIVDGISKIMLVPPLPNPEWDSNIPNPANSAAPYKLYNIGNNQPVELITFIETLERLLGREAQKEWLPIQPGDVEVTYADISGLQKDFNYQPSTSIEQGLRTFVNWYKAFYGKS
ncbi:MAG: hypothetical protein RLZZ248_1082 [Bacteroidota bacterium]